MMGKCCLCGNTKKLIKAHIIPKAFFRQASIGNETPYLISDISGTYKKKSPIGVYDKGILCSQCEAKFSEVDSYAAQILLKQLDNLFQPIVRQKQIIGFQASNINQDLLLRFFVATLWRASVSTHDFYKHVDIGILEPLAKKSILSPNAPVPKEFSAVLFRWVSDDARKILFTGAIPDPFHENLENVNTYRFYFGEVGVSIKADEREFPDGLPTLALCEQPNVVAIARSFKDSKDFSAMIQIVKQHHKNSEKQI